MKVVLGVLWCVFILAVFGALTSHDKDLASQRSKYVQQHQERILRLWAPPSEASGLMFVVPPEARMMQGAAERDIAMTWHGNEPVRVRLQAYTKPHYNGVHIEFPEWIELEPKKIAYVKMHIKITELETNVDTLDVYLNGEMAYAKL